MLVVFIDEPAEELPVAVRAIVPDIQIHLGKYFVQVSLNLSLRD